MLQISNQTSKIWYEGWLHKATNNISKNLMHTGGSKRSGRIKDIPDSNRSKANIV